MVPVHVSQVLVSQAESAIGFVVLLKSDRDKRTLPIYIGQQEAHAIAIRLNNLEVSRPLTHDLLKNVVEHLDATVDKVVVSDLTDNTFFGRLIMHCGERNFDIDCRPSDAIALALRFSVPIFVEEKVMEEAAVLVSEETAGREQPQAAPMPPKEGLNALDLLNAKLRRAIRDEQYEEAARIRDEIQKMTKHN